MGRRLLLVAMLVLVGCSKAPAKSSGKTSTASSSGSHGASASGSSGSHGASTGTSGASGTSQGSSGSTSGSAGSASGTTTGSASASGSAGSGSGGSSGGSTGSATSASSSTGASSNSSGASSGGSTGTTSAGSTGGSVGASSTGATGSSAGSTGAASSGGSTGNASSTGAGSTGAVGSTGAGPASTAGSTGAGSTGGGTTTGTVGTSGSSGTTAYIPDPRNPDNANIDTDCDGLSDAEEFSTHYANGLTTDPNNPDSDGDGIPDGVELGRTSSVDPRCTNFVGDADPGTTTNPTLADTDGDGIPDGVEDANHNGRIDTGETNPANADTDGDGLPDGLEDANHNGVVDTGETDPRKRDTDGDGIPDGIEDKNHNGIVDTGETDPRNADTDGDGCLDGAEDVNWNHVVDPGESNPLVIDCSGPGALDSDGDGIPDGVEDRNHNGIVDPGETDPHNADTDGDGIPDGVEDANHNGLRDPGETDPTKKDTDCDGISDGDEDKNHNGVVDPGETDPRLFDTDGDGLSDGVEQGLTSASIADPVNCPGVPVDADPATKTNPLAPDTDGDGLMDGVEDKNQNGRLDTGESDPNNPNDPSSSTTHKACDTSNLAQVVFRASAQADLKIATAPSFTDYSVLSVNSKEEGALVYDPTNHVAGFAFRKAASSADGGADVNTEETSGRALLNGLGTVGNPLTQTFTTWDGFPGVKAVYQWAPTGDMKTLDNQVAQAFLGNSVSGVWPATAGVAGPYVLQVEYVFRSSSSVAIIGAFVPASSYSGTPLFKVDDLANGSALAQFDDTDSAQCDTFTSGAYGPVDFLWVVDNSGSMGSYQTAVSNAFAAMQTALGSASLDWRMGLVTTSYYNGHSAGQYRTFTTDLTTAQCWFTQDAGAGNCTATNEKWVNTNGNGTEEGLRSAIDLIKGVLTPASATPVAGKLRQGALLVLIILGDADDQNVTGTAADGGSIPNMTSFFRNYDNDGGVAQINGIVCPPGQNCGETQENPRRFISLIQAQNGVQASIQDFNASTNTVATLQAIIAAAAGQASTFRLSRAPISSTFKVAVAGPTAGTCNTADVPRARDNGFDYYAPTNAILFYGDCRPQSASPQDVAVSYRYWQKGTCPADGCTLPCGGCPTGLTCDPFTNACVCPSDCGGTCGNRQRCDTTSCGCVCAPDCGGTCGPNHVCDPSACECACQQTETCGAGLVFDPAACACVCDAAALSASCGYPWVADTYSCTCTCPSDCGFNGGCSEGDRCDVQSCTCVP